MKSFRTEYENQLVEQDIIELEKKIRQFKEGKIEEDKFKSLRLARGVYGQRQTGVQMIRIKIPYGKISVNQLLRIAAISDEYSNGKLHITTRQDIQIHYVSLDKTPELWSKLEKDDITLREACGNTVRNVTASHLAGVDIEEAFDVSPYAEATFKYFLRNPIAQEMGRKIKIAFSANANDTAFSFLNDLGFIPRKRIEINKEVRGFKVLIAGGLGAQPFIAQTAYEFLHEDYIIPFIEAVLRVFDRYGERSNRNKARLKYLVNKIGLDEFIKLVEEERNALKQTKYNIPRVKEIQYDTRKTDIDKIKAVDKHHYDLWLKTNVVKQKQSGYHTIQIKVHLGNFSTKTARSLAHIIKTYTNDDIRLTINQGIAIRFVQTDALPTLFNKLNNIGLANPGFGSTADITSCPGTDTCNLGIANTTGVSSALEKVIKEEYPDLLEETNIKINISGCMNACGQHSIANIGFHGSSIKNGEYIAPALQVLLGGGIIGDGFGNIAEKVIKIPSKKAPDALRILLNDYQGNSLAGEYFNDYYKRQGKIYFYEALKILADKNTFNESDYIDWGKEEVFKTTVGIGECAGVIIDLVSTLFLEAEEKLDLASLSYKEEAYADAIYHTYSAFIHGAKALLLTKDIQTNTHISIIKEFDNHFDKKELKNIKSFEEQVLQIKTNKASKIFAKQYIAEANNFLQEINKIKTNNYEKV